MYEVRSLNTRRTVWTTTAVVIAVIATIVGVTLGSRTYSADSASLQSRVLSIAARLRVPDEHDTMTVANSPEPLAQHMRYEIQQDLLKNQSTAQIMKEMQTTYGRGVLAAPGLRGIGQLVWWLPILVLLVLFGGLIWFLRTVKRPSRRQDSELLPKGDNVPNQTERRLQDFL